MACDLPPQPPIFAGASRTARLHLCAPRPPASCISSSVTLHSGKQKIRIWAAENIAGGCSSQAAQCRQAGGFAAAATGAVRIGDSEPCRWSFEPGPILVLRPLHTVLTGSAAAPPAAALCPWRRAGKRQRRLLPCGHPGLCVPQSPRRAAGCSSRQAKDADLLE